MYASTSTVKKMEIYVFLLLAVLVSSSLANFQEMIRPRCENRMKSQFRPHSEFRHRLTALRVEMKKLDVYIVTSFDEHQNQNVAEMDRRRQFITGFSGNFGDAVITKNSSAIWTDNRYIVKADAELDCEWKIFIVGEPGSPTIPEWIMTQVSKGSIIGVDPFTIPHYIWSEWNNTLKDYDLYASRNEENLVDIVWGKNRPSPPHNKVNIYPLKFAGETWSSKLSTLRDKILSLNCDAIIITSLTEIAYLLNLRGKDIPNIPVFKAYLVVTIDRVFLYTNRNKVPVDVVNYLKADTCYHSDCVRIKDYDYITTDIITNLQVWKKVFLPGHCVYDTGVSEAIYSLIPKSKIFEGISPVLFMKAKKNEVQRDGMKHAHIRDGAAMCIFLHYLEDRFKKVKGEYEYAWSELSAGAELNRIRRAQDYSQGLSIDTIVGYGAHGSMPFYWSSNTTDTELTDKNTIIIESGGHYLDGTTVVTRTIHLGKPTNEQIRAYTKVLSSLIRLSTLVFPDYMEAADVDSFSRGPLWEEHNDYPHGAGHSVGSFLSAHESPINIALNKKEKYSFKDGYFFSNEPGYYKRGDFGIKLENVLEVIDIEKRHPSGSKFLSFRDITLVPFEKKLIDRTLLNAHEKRWLNAYNSRIRDLVGEELKKKIKHQAFYWMMKNTEHMIEYLPKSDYKPNHSNYIYSYPILIITGMIINLIRRN